MKIVQLVLSILLLSLIVMINVNGQVTELLVDVSNGSLQNFHSTNFPQDTPMQQDAFSIIAQNGKGIEISLSDISLGKDCSKNNISILDQNRKLLEKICCSTKKSFKRRYGKLSSLNVVINGPGGKFIGTAKQV
ncbi:hypothetical protein DFA_06787 [Cavenderia fasciculata]|uniref:Uncharacterized protein n=1 Tax=Cavenderia fasciculata TaxID=261658 RepID=F4Q2A0_CACFS|nr:uncharacterized protein DFA_06787 [Cavenderia fasciculata]EGG18120.1 hypothetical protein DFA_06787 [Cavenderia fasciculata]|eukprot:XP_004366161.1 hypothetical protein DFA_06787 [Cavenderia fasciculata]